MWFDVWTSSITMTNSVFLTWIPCNCRNLVFINVFLENFNWANWNELLNISIIDADVFVLHCLKHCFEPRSLHQTLLKGNGIVSNIALSQDHCIISSQVFIPLFLLCGMSGELHIASWKPTRLPLAALENNNCEIPTLKNVLQSLWLLRNVSMGSWLPECSVHQGHDSSRTLHTRLPSQPFHN